MSPDVKPPPGSEPDKKAPALSINSPIHPKGSAAPAKEKGNAPSSEKQEGAALRAMENPISATFDLAETVNDKIPDIKKMVKYASIFYIFALFVNFILVLVFLRENFILFLIVLAFFIIGILSLRWMFQLNKFFEFFASRHIAIKMMRDGDPLVHIPKGKSSLDQLLSHLKRISFPLENLLRSQPSALQAPAIMKGSSGVEYSFDAYISVEPSWSWRTFKTGKPGYALFIKTLPESPEMKDVKALENAINDVVKATGIPPNRAIILSENREGQEPRLKDDVYEHVTTQRFVAQSGRDKFVYNLQIISVDQDGTYDFVPVISDLPGALP
jgi:hypothetical protein